MLPFWGTTLGAACVFLSGKHSFGSVRRAIRGFSAGVMVAASIWSLLIPSMELAEGRGVPAAVPAASGFLCGIVFFLLCDRLILQKSAVKDNSAALPIIGIAVQNFPEGAIVSLPLYSECSSKPKAFGFGVLSGVVEPIGALLTLLAAGIAVPILPYLLGFAAGAMMYAVLEEFTDGSGENGGGVWVMAFSCGFVLMMSLDVLLG